MSRNYYASSNEKQQDSPLQPEPLGTSIDNEPHKNEASSWKNSYPQVMYSLIAFLFTIQAGVQMAYSNLLLEELDTDSVSWLASVGMVATPIGVLMCGPLADNIGRRRAHIAIGIPAVLSWLIFSVSGIEDLILLIIARILGGIATGLTTVTLIYVSEISHGTFRPMLLSLLSVYVSTGVLATTIIGAFLKWKQTAYVFLCFFIAITILVAMHVPETPQWFLHFEPDNTEKAKRSLKSLNPNSQVFEEQWLLLTKNIHDVPKKRVETKWKLTDVEVYKPSLLLVGILFLQQISGVYPIIFYAKKIVPVIANNLGRNINAEVFVLLGIVRLLSCIFTCIISKTYSRKKLLCITTLVLTLSWFLLVLLYNNNILDVNFLHNFKDVISIVLFLIIVAVSSMGIMNVPWTLIPEILPTAAKSVITSFMVSYAYCLSFTVAKIFPAVLETVRPDYLLIFFTFVALLITVYSYVLIPETYGKSTDEILQQFKHSTSKKLGNTSKETSVFLDV